MALPDFVNEATGLDDGVANSLASSLSKLTAAKNGMEKQMAGFEDVLSSLNPEDLPLLPSSADLALAASEAETTANQKMDELGDISDLAGACFAGAFASLKSISGNGFGLIEDALGAYSDITNMPSEMLGVGDLYAKAQQFAASLGIDKIVELLNDGLGCLSDSTTISDVQAEMDNAMYELGLDSSGLPDNEVYSTKMTADLSTYANENGIDAGFIGSMSEGLTSMTNTSNELSISAKAASDAQILSIKETIKLNIPSTPTPPRFF